MNVFFQIYTAKQEDYPFLVTMLPPDSLRSRALVDLVHYFGWTRIAILTSDTDYGECVRRLMWLLEAEPVSL